VIRRWGSWALLLIVVAGALAVGTTDRDVVTDAERAQRVAKSVRCPTCRGQSVADSDAPAAANVRTDIERRVADGQSDDEIRDALAARFGTSILLNPPRSGVAGLVWVLPVAGLAFAGGGLVLAFRRWRREW
jgi:cytochrome c-type biogenesis protein CcmH/NrfF